ncbi:MAG TPA: putative toxin-antitoxin system toxin component, PIN family [Pirellulales bacterium]|jgi:putative PIN family toxin of toxin-antitoxin system|nr:putative toxin-antitoxin system toxin component, PIN family [Pirellulales bacterium]
MLFFRSAARPDRVHSVFEKVERELVTLCLSPDVLAEIRDVLTRPKLQAKYPALTAQAVDAFLTQHLRVARFFNEVPAHFHLQRDPKDSKYLNLAITAEAPYVVTLDRDLLDLMLPDNLEGRDFRSRYPAIRILEPDEFELALRPR